MKPTSMKNGFRRYLINTKKKFKAACKIIAKHGFRSIDLETTLAWPDTEILSVQVHLLTGQTFYFPFRHIRGMENNLPIKYIQKLGELLHASETSTGEDVWCLYYNGQYDIKVWWVEGVDYPANYIDAIHAALLNYEEERSYKLETMADKYIAGGRGFFDQAEKELKALVMEMTGCSASEWKGHLAICTPMELFDYGCSDVETDVDLFAALVPSLKRQDLYLHFFSHCESMIPIALMECEGFPIDTNLMSKNTKECERLREKYLRKIRKLAEKYGRGKFADNKYAVMNLNPGSPKQVAECFAFKDGTSADILKRIIKFKKKNNYKRKVAKALLEYRKYDQALKLYYYKYPDLIADDDRLYPNIRVVGGWRDADDRGGTKTARFSCQEPNLQQVTNGTGEPHNVRDIMIPPPGMKIVSRDYSQAELRLGAFYSGCSRIADAYREDISVDIHQLVADDLSIPRKRAKNVNFSVIYGIGPHGFARRYQVKLDKAKDWLFRYHSKYPEFKQFMRDCEMFARKYHYIEYWSGRRRHFYGSDANYKDSANSLIQGGVAEMIRVAIYNTWKALPWAKQFLTVHDEINWFVPESRVDEFLVKSTPILEYQPWVDIPMLCSAKVGDRWSDMEEIDRERLIAT